MFDSEKINNIKNQIEESFQNKDLESAYQCIQKYEKLVIMDLDLIVYWCTYYIHLELPDRALEYALLGKRYLPASWIMYYNAAMIYQQQGELLSAAEYYTKAKIVHANTDGTTDITSLQLDERITQIWNTINDKLQNHARELSQEELSDILLTAERQKTFYGMLDSKYYVTATKVIGDYLFCGRQKRFVASNERKPFFYSDLDKMGDLMHSQGELLEVFEGRGYSCPEQQGEYLIPVAAAEPDTLHEFREDGQCYAIRQKEPLHFNYYRIKEGTDITSSCTSYYGKAIPLRHSPKRKRLVLNIFVDGLSQEILNGKDFEETMPCTYRFFKKGTICTHAYSTAEWTFPSLSCYVTGLDTLHHMMFHNSLCTELPEDTPTLAEYFQEQGYLTTKMDGSWRTIPPYGHLRGYQRYIFHNQNWGSKGEKAVSDAIGQIEAFKDTDHFLWMCMGDLHDVADEYDLPIAVQSKLPVKNRMAEEAGATSVKQAASLHKVYQYKQMAAHTDMLLNRLYQYIEDTFSEDEILISLFGDHGQGYLIPAGGHFVSKERAKVALMFRGVGEHFSNQISEEILSIEDYLPIMCKLAGIPQKDIKIQGNLPVCFGGKEEREYAISESLHPGDIYQATFFAKDYTVYFKNGVPAGQDGRFPLQNETIEAVDPMGKKIVDREFVNNFYQLAVTRIAHLLIH